MEDREEKFFPCAVRGAVLSVTVALALVLLFALIIGLFGIGDTAIKPTNQVLKALALFVGCFFALKGRLMIFKGLAVGIIFTVVLHIIFSLVSGNPLFSTELLFDMLFGTVLGTVFGIIKSVVKNR